MTLDLKEARAEMALAFRLAGEPCLCREGLGMTKSGCAEQKYAPLCWPQRLYRSLLFFSVEALISGYVDPNPKPHSEKQQAHVRCLAYQLAPHATVLNGT